MVVGTGLGYSQWGGEGTGLGEGERKWKTGRAGERIGRGQPRVMEEPGLWGKSGNLGAQGLGVSGVAETGWAGRRAMGCYAGRDGTG